MATARLRHACRKIFSDFGIVDPEPNPRRRQHEDRQLLAARPRHAAAAEIVWGRPAWRPLSSHASYGLSPLSPGTDLLEQIQRRVDLRQQAFDFRPLVRAGIFVESFHKPLLSRQKVCNRCHRTTADRGRRNNSRNAGLFRRAAQLRGPARFPLTTGRERR
jgi:hypothetical protein